MHYYFAEKKLIEIPFLSACPFYLQKMGATSEEIAPIAVFRIILL